MVPFPSRRQKIQVFPKTCGEHLPDFYRTYKLLVCCSFFVLIEASSQNTISILSVFNLGATIH